MTSTETVAAEWLRLLASARGIAVELENENRRLTYAKAEWVRRVRLAETYLEEMACDCNHYGLWAETGARCPHCELTSILAGDVG